MITYGQALQRVAERTHDNRKDLEQKNKQRRNGIIDLYGEEYHRVSNSSNNARIYISVTPDLIYLERFEFKLIISESKGSNFRVSVGGVDITAYLMAQQGGQWITGDGIYPATALGEDGNYDLLEVACDMVADGNEEEAETLLKSGYKRIDISSNRSFEVTFVLYEKLTHVNR